MRNDKGQFTKKHGMVYTSEYGSWFSMKQRCLNPDKKHLKYKDIKICQEWIDSFEKFYADMGPKPTPKHTIERIDNALGYFKLNCRWATRSEQNRNYSLNNVLEFDGKKMCVTDWAEHLGVSRFLIYNRLQKGWSTKEALTTPLGQPRLRCT